MSIADNIAAEHVPTYWRSFANDVDIIRCCGKDFGPHPTRKMKRGDEDKAKRDYAAHVAEVTEAAVRAQIEAELTVWMRHHDGQQVGFSAIGDTYAHAARIARGDAA